MHIAEQSQTSLQGEIDNLIRALDDGTIFFK